MNLAIIILKKSDVAVDFVDREGIEPHHPRTPRRLPFCPRPSHPAYMGGLPAFLLGGLSPGSYISVTWVAFTSLFRPLGCLLLDFDGLSGEPVGVDRCCPCHCLLFGSGHRVLLDALVGL